MVSVGFPIDGGECADHEVQRMVALSSLFRALSRPPHAQGGKQCKNPWGWGGKPTGLKQTAGLPNYQLWYAAPGFFCLPTFRPQVTAGNAGTLSTSHAS